ncbi:MAG TPA: glycosyltransferase family 4 protein [Natronosporangium sp.]
MLIGRLAAVARTIRRRYRLALLGLLLVAVGVAAAVVDSWLAAGVTVLSLAAVAVAVREARRSRRAVRALTERVDRLERRARERQSAPEPQRLAAEIRNTRRMLAAWLYDRLVADSQVDDAVAGLPAALLDDVVLGLVDRGDLLDAYALATRTHTLRDLPVGTLRQLRQGLWQRGYVVKALDVAEVIAEFGATEADRRAHRQLDGELGFFAGPAIPQLPSPAGYSAVPGRILHIVGRALPHQSGYTIRTHNIARAQREIGLDPHVLTRTGGELGEADQVTRDELDGIPYHRLPYRRNGQPFDQWLRRYTERVAELVARLRPAVLHAASDFVNASVAVSIGRAFGIPVVYESRGFWEETWLSHQADRYGWDLDRLRARHGEPDLYRWRRAIEDQLRREADHVVTLADVMADRIEAGGVPRSRITVVPNAVAVADFPVVKRDAALAVQLGIPPSAVVVGYISSLVGYEGIDTLIAGYAEVRGRVPVPTRLLIVGDGPARAQLEEHAAALDVADEVIFTGEVPHRAVVDYYSLIDIFVVPRKPVAVAEMVIPLKPFEAFATGRAVVLSDVRALAGIADESGAASLFEAGNPSSLATVLSELILDPARRDRLAARGARWVREHRSWAGIADRYRAVYAGLGATSSSPAVSG